MRITRVIAVLIGLALFALTLGSTATAEASADAKPQHSVFATGKEIGHTNKFVAFGKVSTFRGGTIAVQRKNCSTCKWGGYKKIKTAAKDGHFRTGIEAGRKVPSRVCYRVNIPATKDYRRTVGFIGCINTKRV